MTPKERAVDLFRQGFNCSQAVFVAYRQHELLDEATALRLSTAFGAGVAHTGKSLCGAVSGALMAISMKHGRGDPAEMERKLRTYELSQSLMQQFESCLGSCQCRDVIGIDIGIPENRERAKELKLFETKCAEAVRVAADILDRLL